MFEIFDFGHTVEIDEIVVFFGWGEGSVDPVAQVFDAYVLIVPRCHGFHKLCRVLQKKMEKSEDSQISEGFNSGSEWLGGREAKAPAGEQSPLHSSSCV